MTGEPSTAWRGWSDAWLEALQSSGLDATRLTRGRAAAADNRVELVDAAPGSVSGRVAGDDNVPSLSLRTLNAAEWDSVLATLADTTSDLAALLGGRLPASVAEVLLPHVTELGVDCGCNAAAEPCRHVAALCHEVAHRLDLDPFLLTTLRGRSREELVRLVRARRSPDAHVDLKVPTPRGVDQGIPGADAWRTEPAAQRPTSTVGPRASTMRPLRHAPPIDAGLDRAHLKLLVDDAARRAWSMLATGARSHLDLTVGADVVRRAAAGSVSEIASATGLDPTELELAARAWGIAGEPGFRAQRDRWEPPDGALQRAIDAFGSTAVVRANTVTDGEVQLRLDAEGRWWRFDLDEELGFTLSADAAGEPADLL